MISTSDILALVSVAISGVNLVFILRLIFNDLHELRQLLLEHLRNHAQMK